VSETASMNTAGAPSSAPKQRGKRRWPRWLAMGGAGLVGILGLMKVVSMQSHDRDNPRSLPNSYLMTHEVVVDAPPEQVFYFITHRLKDHYAETAEAHERFEIIGSDHLSKGAVFVSEEFTGGEGVYNRYVVRELVPNRLIHMASTPSTIYERTGDQLKRVGTCNAHVYFDLKHEAGSTRLGQTLVLQMPNFLVKFLIDVIASQTEDNEWHRHLVEELEGLKKLVEEDAVPAAPAPTGAAATSATWQTR
jgi:hypothetical protein